MALFGLIDLSVIAILLWVRSSKILTRTGIFVGWAVATAFAMGVRP